MYNKLTKNAEKLKQMWKRWTKSSSFKAIHAHFSIKIKPKTRNCQVYFAFGSIMMHVIAYYLNL